MKDLKNTFTGLNFTVIIKNMLENIKFQFEIKAIFVGK